MNPLNLFPFLTDFLSQPVRFAYREALNSFRDAINQLAAYVLTLTPGRQYVGTSTSNVVMGVGDKNFVIVESSRAWITGTPLRFTDTTAPATRFMTGVVKTYDPVTGALVATIAAITGAGTLATWSISVDPGGAIVSLSSIDRGAVPVNKYLYVGPAGNVTGVDLPDAAVQANYAVSQLMGGM
jgi:hypothetical protein